MVWRQAGFLTEQPDEETDGPPEGAGLDNFVVRPLCEIDKI